MDKLRLILSLLPTILLLLLLLLLIHAGLLLLFSFLFSSSIFAEPNLTQIKQTTKIK
jgi:hypothetical protein